MPFATITKPSIQLGLLHAIAAARGIQVESFHLALNFAQQIGVSPYEALAKHRGHLFGDWLFSAAAFGADAPGGRFLEEYRSTIERSSELGARPVDRLRALRDIEVPRFLDHVVKSIDWPEFDIVGFTSTFQQNVASFALAARIKERDPSVVTLFGGANFDGEMGAELVRSVKCIDYAVSGEADEAFPEFLTVYAAGGEPADVPGIICRRGDTVVGPKLRSPFASLDTLPTPNYDDYFARAEALGILDKVTRRSVGIPFESARGCWWGQKHHCTFCGLNAETMTFRAKSPHRLLEELAELSQRYRTFHFEAVDNILSMAYLESFLPALLKENCQYCLFYETKANLRREQIRLLSEAGVRCIQPGIESFSSNVLALMRKGVRAAQNVNLLRWASYYNINVIWNIIWGFPGESETDYRLQSALLPHLVHLDPPLSASRIWMERFSPIFADRGHFPMRCVGPEASYGHVYPRHMQHERLAYFFDYELTDPLPDSVYAPIIAQVRAWQSAWERPERPTMTFRHSREFLQIDDRRQCGEALTYTLAGPLASLYAASSERPVRSSRLQESLAVDWSIEKIEATLDQLCTKGLMMRDGEDFLSLALPAGGPAR
jgi:ribosomal peptide maturation radical SAM protein 1